MPNINDLMKHEVYLQRTATELVRTHVFASLDEAYKAIERILKADFDDIRTDKQLKKLTEEIRKVATETAAAGWQGYSDELSKVAVFDAAYYAELIGFAKLASNSTIQDFIDDSMLILSGGKLPQTGIWADFVNENVDGFAKQIDSIVRVGITQKQTARQVASSIKLFAKGQAELRADALARTGMRHYTEGARRAMARANADIIEREIPFVVFDNRLSTKCAGIAANYPDGWVYGESPVGYPPYHPNCRTQIIYKLEGMGDPRKDLTRASIGSGKNYPDEGDKPTYKGRASSKSGVFKVEQIDADTSVGAWLKQQDPEFVADTLGKAKSELFLNGKLPIAKMSDIYGRPLKVDELISKYPDAAKRAGLI